MFSGILTALITPFDGDAVDETAFQRFVEWQVEEGVHGLVPTGTTGESPTLTYEEHCRVITLCVEAAAGRAPVIAGTGANSTAEAVHFTQHAKTAGADAALVVSPYYNKPTPEGVYQHFKTIHDAAELPIILYNIPGRSVIDMGDALIARLAALPRIAGLKDATGDLARVCTLQQLVGDDFCLLSGEDMTALAFNVLGGQGCISVTANIAPKLCAEMQSHTLAGRWAEAREVHDRLIPLHQALFAETSPAPAKYAASLQGRCRPDLRLPLVEPREETKARVREAVEGLGIRLEG